MAGSASTSSGNRGLVLRQEEVDGVLERVGDEIAKPPDLSLRLPHTIEQLEDLIELLAASPRPACPLLGKTPDQCRGLARARGPEQDNLPVEGQAEDAALEPVEDGAVAERDAIDHLAPDRDLPSPKRRVPQIFARPARR
jgi:hypothetical protein